jgi:hypothetical protein
MTEVSVIKRVILMIDVVEKISMSRGPKLLNAKCN